MTYNELLSKIEREKLKKPVLFLYESTYLHFTIYMLFLTPSRKCNLLGRVYDNACFCVLYIIHVMLVSKAL